MLDQFEHRRQTAAATLLLECPVIVIELEGPSRPLKQWILQYCCSISFSPVAVALFIRIGRRHGVIKKIRRAAFSAEPDRIDLWREDCKKKNDDDLRRLP